MNDNIELKKFEGSCYVCFTETDNKSPCSCEAKICKECYKNVIKNNGINCTICKKKFDDELINISVTNEENYEIVRLNVNGDINDLVYDNIKLFFILLIIFFLTPLFGIIFRLLLNLKLNGYFSIENFLFGLIIWLLIITIISIINFFLGAIIYFFNLT